MWASLREKRNRKEKKALGRLQKNERWWSRVTSQQEDSLFQ